MLVRKVLCALGMSVAALIAQPAMSAEVIHYDSADNVSNNRGTGGFASLITVDNDTSVTDIGLLLDLANADGSGFSDVTLGIFDSSGNVLASAMGSFADDGLTYKWLALPFTFSAGVEYFVGGIANNANSDNRNVFGSDVTANQIGGFNFFVDQRQLSGQLAFTGQTGTRDIATAFRTAEVTSAVPETSTWAMLLLGFGLLGGVLRSRRRKNPGRFSFA